MSNISSDTLFHFTPKPDYLFQILEYTFRPRYYPEIISFANKAKPLYRAIPMVCFCDIPLSQIKNHLKVYGCYGIGMNKDWASKNKLNPVMYIKPGSKLALSLVSIIKNHSSINTNLVELQQGIYNVIRYLKNYEGDFFREGKVIKDIKFYNEREWRHVPELKQGDGKFWLTEEEYQKPVLLADNNSILEHYPLSFEPKDIKYVIINKEGEIPTMINALKRIKNKYSLEIIDNLVSRIITVEQIENDF